MNILVIWIVWECPAFLSQEHKAELPVDFIVMINVCVHTIDYVLIYSVDLRVLVCGLIK